MKKPLPLFAAAVLAFAGTAYADRAAAFPDKPVKIVVPQAPGGGTDSLARLMAQKLSEHWNQPVVVENKPGAGGIIGLEAVANSPKDGYTLLMSSDGPQAINVGLYKSLPYDPVKDFTPIATVGTIAFLIAANNAVPVDDFQGLIELARTSPNLNFGSAGNGSLNHLIGEMINQATGMKLVHVPYKGAAPAVSDLLGGHLTTVVASVPSVAAQVDSGALKALAVTSARRSERLPNLPTISEFGYARFGVSPWIGLLAPGGVPAQIVEKINADVNRLLEEAAVEEAIRAQGMEPFSTTPAEFAEVLEGSIASWGTVIREAGVTID